MRSFAYLGTIFFLSHAGFGQAPAVFSVADVHASPYAARPNMSGGVLRAGRYVVRQANMVDLVRAAYGVEADDVLGGPSWLEMDRFDVVAKASPATTPETLQRMLQALLADRFHLVVHRETRPMPAFVLSMGKGKPKLKEAAARGDSGCQHEPPQPPQPGFVPPSVISCHGVTMEGLAATLHLMAGTYLPSPVTDATGLQGTWDFKLEFTPRPLFTRAGADGITVFDAVDKQLGLKLEAQKVPTTVIVVESVNEKPTPSPPGVTTSLPPPPPAEFEVAVLKRSAPDAEIGGTGFQPGGRVDLLGFPLTELIRIAYGSQIDPREGIPGAPKWVNSANYDLVAKSSTIANLSPTANRLDDEDFARMVRKLLEDRLKLASHFEDRPETAYTLVADKPKLKKADPANRAGCKVEPAPITPGGARLLQATCRNMTMAQFADRLQSIAPPYCRYAVLDGSGLEGAWDFTLTFIPVPARAGGGGGRNGSGAPASIPAPSVGAPVAAEPTGGMTLFEAVERQLGMKLEMHKRDVPVFVIDHIEEKPVDN
jgi:uncharacterized protein (TIGR03435 family)